MFFYFFDSPDLCVHVLRVRCYKCGRPIGINPAMKRCPFCRAKLLKGN